MGTFGKNLVAALGLLAMTAQAVPASANNGEDWRRNGGRTNTPPARVQASRPQQHIAQPQVVSPRVTTRAFNGPNWSGRTWTGERFNNNARFGPRNFNNPAWTGDRWNGFGTRTYNPAWTGSNWNWNRHWRHYRQRNDDIAAGLIILGLAGLFLANGSPYYDTPAWNAPCFNDIYGFRGYYHDGGCYEWPAP